MDLRLTFNENASNYDKYRPTYPDEMYKDIIGFSGLDDGKKALEIGIGTGQATLPFLKIGCIVTAIEIGDKLAKFTREKFKDDKNFEVINQDFESVQLDGNHYDLVYSASAFHWIPQEIGLPKVYRILKSGGVFAWFSNQPAPSEEHVHIHEELQKIYRRHSQFFKNEPVPSPEAKRHQAERKRLDRFNALKQYGFTDVITKLYYGTRTLNAEDYSKLIGTYSDHMAMPDDIRIPFLNEIADTIEHCGGRFTLSDTVILGMGRKP